MENGYRNVTNWKCFENSKSIYKWNIDVTVYPFYRSGVSILELNCCFITKWLPHGLSVKLAETFILDGNLSRTTQNKYWHVYLSSQKLGNRYPRTRALDVYDFLHYPYWFHPLFLVTYIFQTTHIENASRWCLIWVI